MPFDALQLLQKYNCTPSHLGGSLAEYYRAKNFHRLDTDTAAAAVVLFILEKGQLNKCHRVSVDEIWLFHHGAPLLITLSTENGECTRHILSTPGTLGSTPFLCIPANTWMCAQSIDSTDAGENFSCASCITVPAFTDDCLVIAKNNDIELHTQELPLIKPATTSSVDIIKMYELSPLPEEGGMFKEIYRSTFRMNDAHNRECATLIYYMLAGEQRSAWHSLTCDELWFYLGGAAVRQTSISPDKNTATHILGPHIREAERLFSYIPAHYYQSAETVSTDKDDWSLVACLTVPAFDFKMFRSHTDEEINAEMYTKKEL
jgi:uncharacterized protein